MVAEPDDLGRAAPLEERELDPGGAFVRFDRQDSGCVSYGIEVGGHRWFVKTATTTVAATSLENARRFHEIVRHPAIVGPVRSFRTPTTTLVYPWRDGRVLNHATTAGADRSALERFRRLPVDVVDDAIRVVLDAHREITSRGLVAVDFYDGCLLFDFDRRRMWLIDLDEYRPGPFVLDADRLPGSTSYMAPEELERGAVIDERTTVFGLGRMIHHLLTAPGRWRGSRPQRAVVDRATAPTPQDRYPTVAALTDAWSAATSPHPAPTPRPPPGGHPPRR